MNSPLLDQFSSRTKGKARRKEELDGDGQTSEVAVRKVRLRTGEPVRLSSKTWVMSWAGCGIGYLSASTNRLQFSLESARYYTGRTFIPPFLGFVFQLSLNLGLKPGTPRYQRAQFGFWQISYVDPVIHEPKSNVIVLSQQSHTNTKCKMKQRWTQKREGIARGIWGNIVQLREKVERS